MENVSALLTCPRQTALTSLLWTVLPEAIQSKWSRAASVFHALTARIRYASVRDGYPPALCLLCVCPTVWSFKLRSKPDKVNWMGWLDESYSYKKTGFYGAAYSHCVNHFCSGSSDSTAGPHSRNQIGAGQYCDHLCCLRPGGWPGSYDLVVPYYPGKFIFRWYDDFLLPYRRLLLLFDYAGHEKAGNGKTDMGMFRIGGCGSQYRADYCGGVYYANSRCSLRA